jgi:hypothetical protein
MNRQLVPHSRTPWHRPACLVAAACVAAATAGCQHDEGAGPPPPAATTQPVPTIPSAVNDFIDAQIANGASGDATLYRGHFDGDRLNSLGREKLALVASHHEPGQHVTVYVDSSDDAELPAARRDAITAYLTHAGLTADELEVRAGPNADAYYTHPAAESIRGLLKTDSDYQSQQTDASMSGSGGGYGGASGGGPSPAK